MAKANSFSFLLLIVFLTTLQAEARESKYFSKFNPQLEQPPSKPSSKINTYNNNNFENQDSDFPTEEFIENINKDSSKTTDFPRDLNEHSYVTVPQSYKKFNPAVRMRASANGVFELSMEEKKFFDEKEATKSYASYNQRENVHAEEAQGMSDTRTLENGKYYFNPVVGRANKGDEGYFGNRVYKSKSDEFRPLKDFEYNPQNLVGFVP